MSLAYLGTSAFAADLLGRLVAAGRPPALVVTRPDRPAGRGRRLQAPPVADRARELGLEVHQPEAASDDATVLACSQFVVCAYGAMVRDPLLARGVLNVHPSLLPRWRGAAPVERAIMAGDELTGVAIMRLVEGLDEGPVGAMEKVPIEAADDFGSLSGKLVDVAARLLVAALDAEPTWRPQEGETTYAAKIAADDRLLSSGRTAASEERRVRALHPHIGARASLDGEVVRVLRARVGDGPLALDCSDGPLELLEVQPPGRRPMDAAAYLRGRR